MQKYNEIANSLYDIATKLGNARLISLAGFLRQRIAIPDSYVACLGETSSGKSTILNKIIGEDILPTSPLPTTGAITEICLQNSTPNHNFYAINNDATMEIISKEVFMQLALKPDKQLSRLRYVGETSLDWNGVRWFDTPGYGSLVKEHEEVLMDFLPNCNAVVYVVEYRKGIQKNDFDFLETLSSLVVAGTPICVVINRCPGEVNMSDRRVKEIVGYIRGLLENDKFPVFLVKSFSNCSDSEIIEMINPIKDCISTWLHSEERMKEMDEAFRQFLLELIGMEKQEVDCRITLTKTNNQEQDKLKEYVRKLIDDYEYAKNNIIIPDYNELISRIPRQVENHSKNICDAIYEKIDNQTVFVKDEMLSYVNVHALKFYANKEIKDLQMYLEVELEEIDRKVNNHLQTALVNIERDLKAKDIEIYEKLVASVIRKNGGELIEYGLLKYFATYGGRGGSSAGVANAASHMLKKVGDIFGKTFSRETHNTLKHFIAKLGLNSTKALSAAVSVILDVVGEGVDLAIWKSKLKKQVEKALKGWSTDITGMLKDDLAKMRDENIEFRNEEITEKKQFLQSLDCEEKCDTEILDKMLLELINLEGEIL